MTRPSIDRDLQQVARRLRWQFLWKALTLVWVAGLATGCLALWYTSVADRPWPSATLAFVILLAAAAAFVAAAIHRLDLRRVAHRVEQAYPELETRLLAAYEQELRVPPQQRGYLAQAVIGQAQLHAQWNGRWKQAVPTGKLIAWSTGQTVALALLVAMFVSAPLRWSTTAQATAASMTTNPPASQLPEFEVEPGDVELERGADLLVLARFTERAGLPNELTLAIDPSEDRRGAGDGRVSMQQSLSDPIFAARLPEVQRDLSYRIVVGDHETRPYRVTVFEYPELERADAELRYPEYTSLAERHIEDVRQVNAVEGTELRWLCRLNKPVTTARLTTSDGASMTLAASPDDPTLVVAAHTLTTTQRWRLELVDDRGRKNRETVEFVAKVIPNRPPELKLTFPRRDLKVSPLQEIPLEAQVTDDFGVVAWGLAFELIGKKTETVMLGEKLAPQEHHIGRHLVALEDLSARPDELLAWHVWADDLGPDGGVRRTTSDIFFAEVSPFEEIFREQPSDDGPPGESQAAADEALKLQKQIIAATWNVMRRERPAAVSPNFAADVQTIADSQQRAIESLEAMREKLTSDDAKTILATVEHEMRDADRALRAAVAGPTLGPLNEALAAEQAAYQGLLRLRARENRVSRSKGAPAGGAQQSAGGQDLDQLELSEDDQRYESRRRASEAGQTPAQREREAFLNRLRELARRQEDTNQKIKELQAALDAARDEQAKRELDRQLKRLRDEQRDLLREVDQLKNDFDQPAHNQPLAEASKQLDATREEVRQASDALDKGQTPQALTAGARAERELDKLREDFRKQTASQYADEVRDLVDRARTLDERQQRIGEQLTGDEQLAGSDARKPERPKGSLRSRASTPESEPGEAKPSKASITEQLDQQRKELGELLDHARELTERAEENEPLMTKQLYEALREAHHTQTQRAVEIMRQLVHSGLEREAAKVEPRAEQGVRQLRTGIERAAESVLGDDLESLRRAKRDVDQLAQSLEQEMTRESPGQKSPGSEQPSAGDELPQVAKRQADGKSAKKGGSPQGAKAAKAASKQDALATDGESSSATGAGGALGGADWRQWSDTLRNVEEFVPGTRLRSAAARVREQAQAVRAESKRHSQAPNWDLVRETVYEPLVELQRELSEELLRRASPEAVVPLDRDPVPDRFGEAVRRYYERLGSGQ